MRSDLLRVAETARYTEQHLGIEPHIDARWREIDVGTWMGLTHEEVSRESPSAYPELRAGKEIKLGGGESYRELRERVAPALWELADGTTVGTVLVFTHGGPVRAAVSQLLELPPGGEQSIGGPANCALTGFERTGERWRMVAYNATEHLDGLGPLNVRS